MVSLFHQNMQNYTDGARNAQFDTDFAAIRAITGRVYAVAGFTEIRNYWNGMAFAQRALALDPGLTQWTLIEVGITAVGRRTEFVGIAWDTAQLTAQHAGQVLYDSFNRQWVCFNTAAAPPAPVILLPNMATATQQQAAAMADSRGLAYVAGTANGTNCIFGFMHNMYWLGNRSAAFSAISPMVAGIAATIGFANYDAYVGGDFNVLPRDPGGALYHVAALDATGAYYENTTRSNPYDFWLTDAANLGDDDASVWDQTYNSGASDHSGVKLIVW